VIRPALLLLLASVLAACSGPRSPATGASPQLADPDAEQEVSTILEAAVTGDPKGNGADSLYSAASTVVANGSLRLSTPRLAGVQPGGSAAITTSEVSVRGGVAWAMVQYRWFSTEQNQVRLGRATVVLMPRSGGRGWWIVHAHSSTSR
jgi:hypothetical protein